MTPSIPSSAAARTKEAPLVIQNPNPAANTDSGDAPKPFQGTAILKGILQATGRLPTHPLTAATPDKAPPKPEHPKKQVSPADVKKAEGLRAKGDGFIKKKDLKHALECYLKAYQTNPNELKNVFALAQAMHAAGDLFAAHDLYSDYLESQPKDDEVRGLRVAVDQQILGGLQRVAPKVPKEKQAEFVQTFQQINLELGLDNATLFAGNGDKLVKGLQSELEKIHGASKDEKQNALTLSVANAQQILQLAMLPSYDPDPKAQKEQSEKLVALAKSVFASLETFVNADSDPEIKGMAALYKGYQSLIDGNAEDAANSLATVREAGFKRLGDGDAAKGEKALQEKVEQAKKLAAEQKLDEADKVLAGIPAGLLDAYAFLKQYEGEKLRAVNLAACEAWEASIYGAETVKAKDVIGFWHDLALKFGKHDVLDDMAIEARKDCDLIDEVRKQLKSGDANTIQEALEAIRDKGTGDLKARATADLEKAKAGTVELDGFNLGQFLTFTSKVKPTSEDGENLVKQATVMLGKNGSPRTAGLLCALVMAHSSDKAQRDTLKAMYDKLPEFVRKELGLEIEKKG